MKLVVGLGNPGSQYARTRHNIGWQAIDRLADRAGWAGRGRQRDASSVVMGRYKGLDLTLVKPMTFMNDSGLAVRKVVLTGFLSEDAKANGRPVGVAIDRRGGLLVADDVGNTVWRVSAAAPSAAASAGTPPAPRTSTAAAR